MNPSDSHRTQLANTTSRTGLSGDQLSVDGAQPEFSPDVLFVDRYEFVRPLGQGGFGTVVLARDTQLDRMVAIKVPNPGRFRSPSQVGSIIQEAKMAANLRHDGIVTVFDVGTHKTSAQENVPFLVLEYIQGRTLSDLMANETWSHDFSAKLMMDVALALQHAHDEGFIHRDLKPQNILLDSEDRPRISDFGLAVRQRDLAGDSPNIVGTPMYMAPEQATGENHRIDHRTDIWALGVIFYQLLCRQPPFAGSNVREMIGKIMRAEYVPPKVASPNTPVELDRICVRCLSGRMSQRYRQAKDFAADLAYWLQLESEGSGSIPGSGYGSGYGSGRLGLGRPSSGRYLHTNPRMRLSDDHDFVVSRGLRSYRPEDHHFFMRLLPGPHDRSGLPVHCSFWLDAIGQRDSVTAIGVGVLYGPSGSGKSSFIRAGVLPFLADEVTAIYVDATSPDLESRLVSALRSKCSLASDAMSLAQLIADIREGMDGQNAVTQTPKIVIVIDQFEQWLARDLSDPENELVRGLRQCDGGHVQCVLIVRDDFWLPVTRLMHLLDVNVVDGENAMLIDNFDAVHAKHVLATLGRSMSCLPSDNSEVTASQTKFMDRAIAGLSEQGRLYPIHLAIFAELVRKQVWNEATLDQLGGTEGIALSYLDHSLGVHASAARRVHTEAAMRILDELMPPTGNIKKPAVSRARLLLVSGYSNSPSDFESLMRILDGELRLLTPVLQDGSAGSEDSGISNESTSPISAYQLTHDFLVPAIRQWLVRDLRSQRGGRQQLMLREQANIWSDRPSPKYLPSAIEYLLIRWHTNPRRWSAGQSRMMKAASRRLLKQVTMLASVVAVCIGFSLLFYQQQQQRIRKNNADRLMSSLRDVSDRDVPSVIDQLVKLPEFTMVPSSKIFHDPNSPLRDRVRFGLACLRSGPDPVRDLVEWIPSRELDAKSIGLLCDELRPHDELASKWIREELSERVQKPNELFPLAVVLSQVSPGDPALIPHYEMLVRELIELPEVEAEVYGELLAPIGDRLLSLLYESFDEDLDSKSARSIALAIKRFQNDSVDELPALLSRAKSTQFHALTEVWSRRFPDVRREILRYIDRNEPLAHNSQAQANLAVALLLTGDRDYAVTLAAEKHSPERALMIQTINAESVDLWRVLDIAEDVVDNANMLSVMVLALDEYLGRTINAGQRARVEQLLRFASSMKRDAELSLAAEVLLKRWGVIDVSHENNDVSTRYEAIARDRPWWVDSLGERMVVVAVPATAGSGAYRIAVGANEIPVGLVRQFEKAINQKFRLVEGDSRPATSLHPSNIHAFCNWYSERLGVDRKQWCYDAKQGSLRSASESPKPDATKLVGIRLPTRHEWVAAAGGPREHWLESLSPRTRLKYAWLGDGSESSTRSVGLRLPNPNGLIDLYGNVAELAWVNSANEGKSDGSGYCIMGHSVLSRTRRFAGDASQETIDPRILDSYCGFRVVRTLPEN